MLTIEDIRQKDSLVVIRLSDGSLVYLSTKEYDDLTHLTSADFGALDKDSVRERFNGLDKDFNDVQFEAVLNTEVGSTDDAYKLEGFIQVGGNANVRD